MKILFLLSLFFLLTAFGSKKVYWCGDHPCINKKEREAYFKKTMTVEVREVSKKMDKKKKTEIEKLMQKAKIDEKERIKNEKILSKQNKIKNKERIKNEKKLAKLDRYMSNYFLVTIFYTNHFCDFF